MRVKANDLLYLIDRDGHVAIEGLGLIYKIHQKASFDFRNNSLKAPIDKLGFSETIFEKENLKDYLTTNYEISPEKAKAKIDSYVELVIASMLKRGSFTFDDIGTLNRVKGDIEFLPTVPKLSGLPSLKVAPIIRVTETKAEKIKEVIEEKTMPSYDYSRNNEKGISWFKYLLPLLLLLGCIMLWRTCGKDSERDPVDLVQVKNEEVSSEDTKKSTVKIVDESEIKVVENPAEKSVSKIETSNIIDDKTPAADENNGVSPTESDANDVSKSTYQECIIITGTFSKAKNVLKMMEKIQDMNLEIYEESRPNGLTRVGFKFDGSQKDLPQYLREIRQVLGKGAWYLKPQLHVN